MFFSEMEIVKTNSENKKETYLWWLSVDKSYWPKQQWFYIGHFSDVDTLMSF